MHAGVCVLNPWSDLTRKLCVLTNCVLTECGLLSTCRLFTPLTPFCCQVTPALLVGKAVLRGRSWRFCLSLGVMMNTRGLVELIALNIGLTMGILTTRTFSMFVLVSVLFDVSFDTIMQLVQVTLAQPHTHTHTHLSLPML